MPAGDVGTCKMCLLEKPLRKSHLIPKRVYKYLRKGEHRPIRVGRGIALPTDEQIQDHLLCDDCEEVLNSAGKGWVVSRLLTVEKQFPLYDLLTQQKPNFNEDGFLVYFAAQNPQIDTDKLMHFALGIFWKASVHSWIRTDNEPLIELGPYSNKVRLWLRGEDEFPENMYLATTVSRPQRAKSGLLLPYEQTRDQQDGDVGTLKWRGFSFRVPGLSFILNVGKTVDPGIRVFSIHNPAHPIHVDDDVTAKYDGILLEHYQRNRKPKAFWKAMEKVSRERRGPK